MPCIRFPGTLFNARRIAPGLFGIIALCALTALSTCSFVTAYAQNTTTATAPKSAYILTPAKKNLRLKKVTVQRKAHSVTVQIVVPGKDPKSVAPAFKKDAKLQTVMIRFYDKNSDKTSGTSGVGEEHSFGSDELSAVTVTNRHPVNGGKLVEIEFKYEKIETTWVTGGKTASDDWTAQD